MPSLLSGWLVVFFVGATAAACSYVSIAVAIDIPASIRSSLVIAVLPRRGTCIEKQVPKLNLRTEIELMKECGEEWERKGFNAAMEWTQVQQGGIVLVGHITADRMTCVSKSSDLI